MPSEIPYPWLLAETLAWPLCSTVAFERKLIALDRAHVGTLHGGSPEQADTRALAMELDEWLLPRARGWSIEGLRNLRESAWFQCREVQVPLHRYLERIACEQLDVDGAEARLSGHDSVPYEERVLQWRYLSLALPADLLVAALVCRHRCDPAADTVHIGSPDLDRMLDEPVAETHMHVSAAVPFPMLWTGLMIGAATLNPHDRKLERGGPPPFGSGPLLVARLLAAAVARWTMTRFLHHPAHARMPLIHFASNPGYVRHVAWAAGPSDVARRLRQVMHTLVTSRSPSSASPVQARIAEMRRLYQALLPPDDVVRASREQEVAARDPLARWFQPVSGLALPETRFAARALAHLAGPGREDESFARLFWQYQRIRIQCFRHITHQPNAEGLDWFRRHFERISALREPIAKRKYAIALETQSRGLHLASLEMRGSPEDTWYANWRELRALRAEAFDWQQGSGRSPGREPVEVGLVLHWVKQRECESSGRLAEDPRQTAFDARFGRWFFTSRNQVEAVTRLLREQPLSLLWLRGVDVANTELAMPTWVTVPLITELRAASHRTAQLLARRGVRAAPFRVTYHAGEEYRRLCEGLRRIHELVDFGVLTRGDRIGHGLALGASAEALSRARPVVLQPAQERLDDLLWEWERYACQDLAPIPGRETAIRDEARRLGSAIYREETRDDTRIEDLAEARRLRHRPIILARLGYPNNCRPPFDGSPALGLLWRYLTDVKVFLRGQQMWEVRATDLETRSTEKLQAWLRAQIGARAITVESNPSSNWLIGDMRDAREHPSFVLQPIDLSSGTPASEHVPLSINTDNPLTFATCLADEYAYFYAAMLHAGIAAPRAVSWLERARTAGWRSRFTLPDQLGPR